MLRISQGSGRVLDQHWHRLKPIVNAYNQVFWGQQCQKKCGHKQHPGKLDMWHKALAQSAHCYSGYCLYCTTATMKNERTVNCDESEDETGAAPTTSWPQRHEAHGNEHRCVCVYIYMYMHVCVYVCVCVYLHVHLHCELSMYMYLCVTVHTYLSTSVYQVDRYIS